MRNARANDERATHEHSRFAFPEQPISFCVGAPDIGAHTIRERVHLIRRIFLRRLLLGLELVNRQLPRDLPLRPATVGRLARR